MPSSSKNSNGRPKGKLKIFLGMAAGVGKTYEMLSEAHQLKDRGVDVVVGLVETHGREDTQKRLEGLPQIPRLQVSHRGITLEELNIDEILKRQPSLVLVDELAHTNAPGSRHEKRYQDVLEILDAGIDVFTTINIQHLESRKDTIEKIAGVEVRETVPDKLLDQADLIELVDLPPEGLLRRLEDGRVYKGEAARRAKENFFREGTLTALRELSLRLTAERVDHDLNLFLKEKGILRPHKTNERLMIAVGPNASSETLIRKARQIAYNLEAPLTAIYVDTGQSLSDEDLKAVEANLKLAADLGAKVFKVTDVDVARALSRLCRDHKITQVILGKPRRRLRFLQTFSEEIVDRLMFELSDVSIHLVETEESRRVRLKTLLFSNSKSSPQRYLLSLGLCAGLILLSLIVENFFGYSAIGLFLLSAVILMGPLVGRGPLIVGAIFTAVAWNFLFIPPKYTFYIDRFEDILLFFQFVVGALVVGSLSARLSAREQAYAKQDKQSRFLFDLSQRLAEGDDVPSLVQIPVKAISHLVATDIAIFLKNDSGQMKQSPEAGSTWAPSEKEMSVAHWAFTRLQRAGRQSDTLREAEGLHIPMVSASEITGVLSLRPRRSRVLEADEISLLELVASTSAIAFERALSQKKILELQTLERSEKLFKSIFNSVSHELRTPITSLRGFLESMRSHSIDTQEPLESLRRLEKIVSNLLDTTRIEAGALKPKLEWTDLTDVIQSALQQIGSEDLQKKFRIQLSNQLPLLKLDHSLTAQALFNVFWNALLYAGKSERFDVSTKEREGQLYLYVEDRGPGLKESDLEAVFQRFSRGDSATPGGLGLGLAIARTFVELQGGKVWAENRAQGGLSVIISFPIPPDSARIDH